MKSVRKTEVVRETGKHFSEFTNTKMKFTHTHAHKNMNPLFIYNPIVQF